MSALTEALAASFWNAFGDNDPDPMGAYADEETGVVDGRLPIGIFQNMAAALPPPVEPICPPLEDVETIPDQAHLWDGEWDGDPHDGLTCSACEDLSECRNCDPKDIDRLDCLRSQAETRNRRIMFAHAKLAAVYAAQFDYYRQLLAEGV